MAHELGMTVGQLRATMTNAEYVHWTRWFARRAQREQLAHDAQGKG